MTDADVGRRGDAHANPFEHATEPEQPPKGSVLAYQRMAASGVLLDYVSFRAGDGHWYTTGEGPRQRVSWQTLWVAIRTNAYGAVRYATAWAELELPRPPVGQTLLEQAEGALEANLRWNRAGDL